MYCSRECLGKAWKSGHRKLCEMVFDNGKPACIITQTEMQKCLTKAEYEFATGCSRPLSSSTTKASNTAAAAAVAVAAAAAGGGGAAMKLGASSTASSKDDIQRQKDLGELERMMASDPHPAVKARPTPTLSPPFTPLPYFLCSYPLSSSPAFSLIQSLFFFHLTLSTLSVSLSTLSVYSLQTFAKMRMNERGPIKPNPQTSEPIRQRSLPDEASNLTYRQSRLLDPSFKAAYYQWIKVLYYESNGDYEVVENVMTFLTGVDNVQVIEDIHITPSP